MLDRGVVDGYEIELDTTGRSYGLTRPVCHVRHGKFSAELSTLADTGELLHRNGQSRHTPPAYVIGALEKWASDRGYVALN